MKYNLVTHVMRGSDPVILPKEEVVGCQSDNCVCRGSEAYFQQFYRIEFYGPLLFYGFFSYHKSSLLQFH